MKVKKNDNKYSFLFKNTLIFAIGNIGSRLILFLLVPLYTNVLSTDEYGIAELLFTMSELLIPVFTLTIYDAIIRFGLNDESKRNTVIKNALVVWIIGTIVSFFVIPICCKFLNLEEWKYYVVIYMIFRSLFFIEMNTLKIQNKNKIYAINSIIQTILLAILNIYFLVGKRLGIEGYLLSSIISFVITDIIAFIYIGLWKSMSIGKINYKMLKKMLHFSIPMIFTNISWWVVNSSDKFMVEWLLGASALGLYTVAAKIPSLINVFTNIFSQAWGISTIKEIETSNDSNYYVNVFEKVTIFTFFVCIILVTIMKCFMKLYVGKEFFSAWVFIPLLLVSATFASVVSFLGSLYSALKKTFNSMCTTIIGAIINIIINLILIGRIGVMGAVIGTVISYFLVAQIRLIDIRRLMSFHIDLKRLVINVVLILLHSVIISIDFFIIPVSLITITLFIFINYNQIYSVFCYFFKLLRREKNES